MNRHGFIQSARASCLICYLWLIISIGDGEKLKCPRTGSSREQDKKEANLNKMILVPLSGTKNKPTTFSKECRSSRASHYLLGFPL